jgi:ketosteroid isomerase-like protein
MGIVTNTMTDEQRKSVAIEYLKSLDRGHTSDGRPFLELFAEDAQVYFPKWGIATGRDEIGRMFGDIGGTLKSIRHHYSDFNYLMTGTDTFAVEGTSQGEHRDGPWQADQPAWGAGRWCDVFEVRDFLIQRVFIYLDPDYAGRDTDRYPWIDASKR